MIRLRTTAVVAMALSLMLVVSTVSAETPVAGYGESKGDYRFKPQFDGWALSMERGTPSGVYICGELPVSDRSSFVACGSGSGVLYEPAADDVDLTHFRWSYSVPLAGALDAGPGVGLAEVSRGRDPSGFTFAADREPRPVEASGPEAAFEVEWSPHWRRDAPMSFRLTWDAGVAWIPGAPRVVNAPSDVVPFSTVTLNGMF